MRIRKTAYPVLGTNSYDCWGPYITEEIALKAIDIFAEKLKPHGYEYFCFDAEWYTHESYEDRLNPEKCRPSQLDEFGRWNVSPVKFPHGLKFITDYCHAREIRFGIHFFRGIPKLAVERNTRIKGTDYHARDICDTFNTCPWGVPNYGVDMNKPGAQEYYNSVIEYFAENGVDFLKVDDMAEQPAEILAVSRAIDRVDRPILFSLSPGDNVYRGNIELLREHANMFRISGDIWDRSGDVEKGFERWELWENCGSTEECYLDLDMVPFGELQSYIPEHLSRDHVQHDLNEKRQSRLSLESKRTFMTQRVMAASPILFGGNLERTSDEDFALLTNGDALKCNRNGVTGKRIFGQRFIDIRQTPCKNDPQHGWIGIFNRKGEAYHFTLPIEALQLPESVDPALLKDIWTGRKIEIRQGQIIMDLKFQECFFAAY